MRKPIAGVIVALAAVPLLTSSAFALRVKQEQVVLDQLDDYGLCQSKDYSGDWCHDALKRWVKDHPADAFKAGKMTRQKMNAAAALPFFVQAFSAGKGDCKDEDVRLSVAAAVDLPAGTNAEMVNGAKDIGLKRCFADMKDALVEAAAPDSNAFTNICHDLIAKNALGGLKKKKCEASS